MKYMFGQIFMEDYHTEKCSGNISSVCECCKNINIIQSSSGDSKYMYYAVNLVQLLHHLQRL